MKLIVIAVSVLLCACVTKPPEPTGMTQYLSDPPESLVAGKDEAPAKCESETAAAVQVRQKEIEELRQEVELLRNDSRYKERLEDPFGLKAYGRMMEELEAASKPPFEKSRFIGKWHGARGDDNHYYLFKADGTFTFDFGRSGGSGEWRQVSPTAIVFCYGNRREGEEFQAHKLARIEAETLKVEQVDYSNDYVRSPDQPKLEEGEGPNTEAKKPVEINLRR